MPDAATGLPPSGEANTPACCQSGGTSLTACLMSVSSSTSSATSEMWSNESSRRGSNASSIVPTSDIHSMVSSETFKSSNAIEKTASSPEACANTIGSAPMAISASESSLGGVPVPPRRPPLRHTDDPLSRVYPKPLGELNIAEALAREPRKWTLPYWAKNAREVPLPASLVPSSTAAKKHFEDTKDELRRAQMDMAARSKSNR